MTSPLRSPAFDELDASAGDPRFGVGTVVAAGGQFRFVEAQHFAQAGAALQGAEPQAEQRGGIRHRQWCRLGPHDAELAFGQAIRTEMLRR